MSPLALSPVLLALLAGYTDIVTHRIPNALVAAGLGLALLVSSAVSLGWVEGGGLVGVGTACLTAAGTLLVVYPVWRWGALGGGDAKLMVALGAWVGYPAVFEIALLSLVAATLVVLAMCFARQRLFALVRSVAALTGALVAPSLRGWVDRDLMRTPVPLGVAVFLGTSGWYVLAMLRSGGVGS